MKVRASILKTKNASDDRSRARRGPGGPPPGARAGGSATRTTPDALTVTTRAACTWRLDPARRAARLLAPVRGRFSVRYRFLLDFGATRVYQLLCYTSLVATGRVTVSRARRRRAARLYRARTSSRRLGAGGGACARGGAGGDTPTRRQARAHSQQGCTQRFGHAECACGAVLTGSPAPR